MDIYNFESDYYSNSGAYRHVYNRDFWDRKSGNLADDIIANDKPENLFDVGAAMGFLIEDMIVRGVDAQGIEISKYAVSQVDPAIKSRIINDDIAKLGSSIFIKNYDVIFTSSLPYLHPFNFKDVLEYLLKKTKRVFYLSACMRGDEEEVVDKWRKISLSRLEWQKTIASIDPTFKYTGGWRYQRCK